MNLFKDILTDISSVGSSPAIGVIVGLSIAYFIVRKDVIRGFTVALSCLSIIYSTILKIVFTQQRPETFIPVGYLKWETLFTGGEYSFPSTHTVFYTVFFGYLFYLTYSIKGTDRVLRNIIRGVSALFIVLVGSSRVLLGAHFSRDVIAGYVFGFIFLTALIKLERSWEERRINRQLKHKKP